MKKSFQSFSMLVLVLVVIFLVSSNAALALIQPSPIENSAKKSESFIAEISALQIPFIKNEGQVADEVGFYARTFGGNVYVTKNGELVYSLKTKMDEKPSDVGNTDNTDPHYKVCVLKEHLLGAKIGLPKGVEASAATVNYFFGNDKDKWKTRIESFNFVGFGEVYDAIEFSLRAHANNVEKIFTVHPGGKVDQIQLAMDGALSLAVNTRGELEVATDTGIVSFSAPIAFQEMAGIKNKVDIEYLAKDKTYGFKVGNYDHRFPLIIDPSLVYSTYLGGSASDIGWGIAVDNAGNAYVAGWTESTDFPTFPVAAPPYQPASGGGRDVFISKINAAGDSFIYSTYLGGSGLDQAEGIAVDASGNAYVTGQTRSTNFPTSSPIQAALSGTAMAFVTKIDSTGSSLVYSTYLGGSGFEYGNSIALDSIGAAYVTGSTNSADFPLVSPIYATLAGNYDAFITKINAAGGAWDYSTFIGGDQSDNGYGIAVDSTGAAYVTGWTGSTNFPTVSPSQGTYAGGANDCFVTKINAAGNSLTYSTYLGGSADDLSQSIAVDSTGSVYVTGTTYSIDFPTASPIQGTLSGNADAFITKMDSVGSLTYSTYLGGSGADQAYGIALDSSGNTYVTGYTDSLDFPIVYPIQGIHGGGTYDVFATRINAAGDSLGFSTYLGGSNWDQAYAIALDGSGNAYITGYASSTNFPTFYPIQGTYGGSTDGFVAKINNWFQVNTDGFGDYNNYSAYQMTTYNNTVYVGVWGNNGAQVWEYSGSGTTWNNVTPGWDVDNFGVNSMVVHNSRLYVGTYAGPLGAEVWEYDGANWSQVNLDGFGTATIYAVDSLAVFNGQLYASIARTAPQGIEVLQYISGTDWNTVSTAPGFGDPNNLRAFSMIEYNSLLYVSIENTAQGVEIWSYDGVDAWTQANDDGFGTTDNIGARSMIVYNGNLYVGTENYNTGAEVFQYVSGVTWAQVNSDGFGDRWNNSVKSMVVFDGDLFACTWNSTTGGEVWSTAGAGGPPFTDWEQVVAEGFGDVENIYANSMAVTDTLYVGTFNDITGTEIWQFGLSVAALITDADGDGMDDTWERDNFGDLSRDGTGDADSDMLTDLEEYTNNTDPNAIDTDGDGYYDREEIDYSTDPNSVLSVPSFVPNVYYVNANASSLGDGSPGSPWRVLHHAIHVINGGSAGSFLLNVLPGIYTLVSNGGFEPDEALHVTHDNVSIIATPGAILEGIPFQATTWDHGLHIDAGSVSVTGLEIRDFFYEVSAGILVSGGDPVTISNCVIHGNNSGVIIDGTPPPVVIVNGCTIYEHNNSGISVNGSSPQISYNRIYDNDRGLYIGEYGPNEITPTIINNLIYHTSNGSEMQYGIFLEAINSGATVSSQIYHNTINGGTVAGIEINEEFATNPIIDIKYNNITYFSGGVGINVSGAVPVIDYNCFWGNTGTGGTPPPVNNNLFQAPLYMNYPAFDFHLQAGSPCADVIPLSGESVIGLDLDNNLRPQGTGYDIGAYETLSETTPPTVLSVLPVNNATGVSQSTTISAVFSESINPASVGAGSFTLSDGIDSFVAGSYSVVGQTVTLTPVQPLMAGATYTATLTTGISDLAGNSLAADYVWSFTTQINDAPTVLSTTPADGAVDVILKGVITVNFSENVDPQTVNAASFTVNDGSVNITGFIEATNSTATFTSDTSLAFGTTYTATITTAVQDLTGLPLATDYTWSFTTVINNPPSPPPVVGPINEMNFDEADVILLDGGAYIDVDGHLHLETYWQVWRADSGEMVIDEVSSVDFTQYTIASMMLPAGLKYIWRVGYMDEFGEIGWSEENSFKLGTSETDESVQVTTGSDVADYKMVSFVQYPDDPRAEVVFSDELGADYDGNYRIGTYNATRNAYDEYGTGRLMVEPGRGYWFLAREGLGTVVDGVPVTLGAEVFIALDFNPGSQNGWNMVGPPNQANYRWAEVEVVVSDGQTLTPVGTLQSLADDNPYIDRRLWRWESGTYASDTPDTDPFLVMAAYEGYWVKAKQAGVLLRFDPGVQMPPLAAPDMFMSKTWHHTLRMLSNLNLFSKAAVADDNDTPPMPMGDLDSNDVEPVFGGCFVEAVEQ